MPNLAAVFGYINASWTLRTDLICDFGSNPTAQPATTVAAVQKGLLSEAELDRALHRLFDVRLRLGLIPPQRTFTEIKATDFDTPAHRAH